MTNQEQPLRDLEVAIDGRSLRNPDIGVSRYALGMIDTLLAAGAKVTIVSNAPLELDADHAHLPVAVVHDAKRFQWEQRALRAHLREQKYDVYIASNNVGLPALYRGNTHLALVVHDMIPLLFWRQHVTRDPRKAIRHVIAQVIAARKANSVFTVSRASQQTIKRLLWRNAVVVPPAISRSPLPAAHEDEIPYFIYVGGYDRRKNARNVVLGFAKLHNSAANEIKLVMTGRPTPDVIDEIERQGIGGSIELPGVVSEEKKWSLLRGAVASLYPSSYEGYGLPLVEAFQAEVPIITTAHGALAEVGGDAAILVDATSATDIGNKMHQCLDVRFREHHIALGRARLTQLSSSREHGDIASRLRDVLPKKQRESARSNVS